MSGDEPPATVLPDAGPLITLAYADSLDLLLKPGWPVEIVDMVLKEVTRNTTPTSQRIASWVVHHKLTVLTTNVGRHYEEATAEALPVRKSSLGELAIQEAMNGFALHTPPSITDSAALRGWRNSSVGLRGWRYVPPNPKKIRDLIGGLERFAVRKDLSPIACALLVHLEFVTIHPFMDGNGRLGRLLMNQVLLSAGLPWVTIRSDEHVPFFKGTEQAQVDGDATSFIRFVWHLIQQSATDLSARQSRRKTARC